MKVTIKVDTPKYDPAKGDCSIKFISAIGRGNTLIHFEPLLPFASNSSKEVIDFFFIAASVYGIDRFIQRRKNSVDGWSRELKIEFPVSNLSKWRPVKELLSKMLSFLTGDYWDVDFYKSDFNFPNTQFEESDSEHFHQVNLFSGGLDSLIGAINSIKDQKRVLFVSHYDPQMKGPKTDQNTLLPELEKLYPNSFASLPSIRAYLENSTVLRESTFRSRSILFIGLALLIAQGKNVEEIFVPENGTVSLNFPLSPSRRSSCSTRTTHPTVLEILRTIWAKLGIKSNISNPYEFQTKGEMVDACSDKAALLSLLNMSNSCGKRGHRSHWDQPTASHCGVCMPCVYRRAALQKVNDPTTYGTEINLLVPFKTKKAQDIGACLEYLRDNLSSKAIKEELIVNGVNNLNKIPLYTDVVARTRLELKNWIKKVGNLAVKKKAGV